MIVRNITVWACLLCASASFATTYKVQSGDNDHSIAKRNGLSVAQLHKLNPNVNWNKLQIGQALKLSSAPEKTSSPKASGSSESYTVKSGDSDYSIAKRYGISVAKLKELNPTTNFNPLKLGAVVRVPKSGATVAKAPAAKAPAAKAPVVKTVASTVRTIETENAVVIKDNVIVRADATTSSAKRTTVKKYTIAQVIERKNDWFKLKFNTGTTGWIRGDFLEATTKPVPALLAKATPKAAPKTLPAISNGSVGVVSRILDTAFACTGTPYVYGGTSRGGFDCSGFVGYVFAKNGVKLPRTSLEQSSRGTAVSRGNLQSGDLVFFRTRGSRVSHVGIYIGNNKFIHASSGGGRVRTDSLTGYYAQRYAGARRVLKTVALATPTDYEPATALDPEPLPAIPTTTSATGTDIVTK